MVHFILLSGGSGTRLWPLSNETRSKQFLKVLRDQDGKPISMVQRVLSQIREIPGSFDITIATCASQEASIRSQVTGDYSLILEPQRRDTAPAIMLASAHLLYGARANEQDTVIVMPIDTYADQSYYDTALLLDEAVQNNVADIALLGVKPLYPAEKYGYIVPEEMDAMVCKVSKFVEKPDEKTAIDLIEKGALWNCGVFAFRLGYLNELLDAYLPHSSFVEVVKNYDMLPKQSFDYEVVERAESVAVIPYSGLWKDLGTWNTLTEEMAETTSGRVIVDRESTKDVYVINELGIPMVVAGLSNAVVVATPDGMLVTGKEASSNIKSHIVQVMESRPMYEQRKWGEYRVLDSSIHSGGKSLTKELILKPGGQLSYQRHANRREVWTVVSGSGEFVLDGKTSRVLPGSVIDIPALAKHSIRAKDELHIIEVQLGDLLEESDIERFGLFWDDANAE